MRTTVDRLQVVFTDKRRFTRDIQVISGFSKSEVNSYLCKKFAGDWRAEMIVSPETPCKIMPFRLFQIDLNHYLCGEFKIQGQYV